KNRAREASIIARAGKLGAVTVATNMAGRGTDIMLGGNPEFIADEELQARGLSPLETPEEYEEAWTEALEKATKDYEEEHEKVVEVGGLYVLGTERHESRRIDNQLRGRSGRQGDPGMSRFYLSLQDDLLRLFNSTRLEAFMNQLSIPDDQPIESGMVSKAIASAQGQVETQNFEVRKNVLKYDEVLNQQRKVIYAERYKVLEGQDLREQMVDMLEEVLRGYVGEETASGDAAEWDLDKLWRAFRQVYPISFSVDEFIDENGGFDSLTPQLIADHVVEDARAAYEAREEELGEEAMREVERRVILQVMDRKWREHLYEMDYLQEGIGLRAMAQRNPLIEFQREGFEMFQQMLEAIKEESVGFIFNVEVQVRQKEEPTLTATAAAQTATTVGGTSAAAGVATVVEEDEEAAEAGTPNTEAEPPEDVVVPGFGADQPSRLQYSAPSEDGSVEKHSEKTDEYAGTSRNAPCPCGSGKKYKKCHG